MQAWRWTVDGFEPAGGLPLEDRGFRYGMALFESIRVHASKPLFLEAHLHRLQQACEERSFALHPAGIAQAGAFLRTLGVDGFARIYATAGPGSPTDPASDCGLYILLDQRAAFTAKPYPLTFGRETCQPLFGGLKTANYWANVHQLQRARARGAEEALLFNLQADLVSACMANVFLIHGSEIRTPALGCGARDGVIREWVLQQTSVKQCSLFVDDVKTADAIFLTNSWIGLVSASSIEDRPLPAHLLANELAERYEAYICQKI